MRKIINAEEWLSFDDILLIPQRGVLQSRKDADTSVNFLGRELKIPFLSAPMPSVTGTNLAIRLEKEGGLAVLHRFMSIDDHVFQYFESGTEPAVAIGIHDGIERTRRLAELGAKIFVLDVAHAHSDPVIEFIQWWKNVFYGFELKLAVGNVATTQGALDLIEAGADAIKVGIGPGSVCTTRQVTGFGVPQFEAIWAAADAVERSGKSVQVIADGGIRNSGDVVKALAAGADVVMIGKLFAQANEAPSLSHHWGCASEYMEPSAAPEGTIIEIGHRKEPLKAIVDRLAGGLRSGISYGGATNIAELRQNAQWIKITDAGRKESKL
jgi:IMP dehydrogenase